MNCYITDIYVSIFSNSYYIVQDFYFEEMERKSELFMSGLAISWWLKCKNMLLVMWIIKDSLLIPILECDWNDYKGMVEVIHLDKSDLAEGIHISTVSANLS